MLSIPDNDKEDFIRILKSQPSSSFDSLDTDISTSTDSSYQSNNKSLYSPTIRIGC